MRVLLVAILLLFTASSLPAQDSTSVKEQLAAAFMADSQNAHEMAKTAIQAIACFIEKAQADETIDECIYQFRPRFTFLGGEHNRLHDEITRLRALQE